jgi:hypothetical protein
MIEAAASPGYFASNANLPKAEREALRPIREAPKGGNEDKVELSRAARESRASVPLREESPEKIEAGSQARENSEEIRKVAQQIRQELRQQQAELLRRLLEGTDSKTWMSTSRDGYGNTHVVQLMVFVGENVEVGLDASASVNGVEEKEAEANPENYWNAENTSERIVNFAMSFSGAFTGAPEEFADAIKAAVEEGFRQAHAITGDLPGAAGELNRETHRLTFKKLEERLEAWKSSLYNESAQNQAQSVA